MYRSFALVVALLVLTVGGLAGISPVLGQSEDAPSPARGHATVAAQGIAELPASELAWRVTRASAPAEADEGRRDVPGFLLVEQGTLVVSDGAAKARSRLASGEAGFLPSGARIAEVPLGSEPLSFYRIDLVAAQDAANAGNDEMVFVGRPFPSPGGNRDLDLVRDVLTSGEAVELSLADQPAPTLFLVTAGSVGLVPASDPSAEPVLLSEGQGAALGGNVVVTAADDDATFVTVYVGPEIPVDLAQRATTPTPEAGFASLSLQAFACPGAYSGDQYASDCAEPLADIPFTIAAARSGATLEGSTGADGLVAFAGLEADAYSVSGGVPAEFVTQVVVCDSVTADPLQDGSAGAVIPLESGANVACSWYAVPENLRGDGSISVVAHLCPTIPNDPASECTRIDASGASVDGPAVLNASNASVDGAALVWGQEEGVPFGEYVVHPEGVAAPEGFGVAEVRGATATNAGWATALDEANPNVALDIILVPTAQPRVVEEAAPSTDVDSDGDGLPDAQEAQVGTDPASADTDGDGATDGNEIAAGTDPLAAPVEQAPATDTAPTEPEGSTAPVEPGFDSDGDNLTDAVEQEIGTDPFNPDSDGDGLSDFVEVGFDAESATGTNPALWDSDGDGVSDAVEIANGTNPNDPGSS